MIFQFISVFSNLLESKVDGIEVFYNVCGVFFYIMFDGFEVWGVCEFQCEEVEECMWVVIQSWDINFWRNINYRLFELIFCFFFQGIFFVSQYWVIWVLYNFVFVYLDKYCFLLIKEGGLFFLRDIIKMVIVWQEIKEMVW